MAFVQLSVDTKPSEHHSDFQAAPGKLKRHASRVRSTSAPFPRVDKCLCRRQHLSRAGTPCEPCVVDRRPLSGAPSYHAWSNNGSSLHTLHRKYDSGKLNPSFLVEPHLDIKFGD